jgi:hypothetical protein
LPGAAERKSDEAAWLLDKLVGADEFVDFLTEPAYELVSSLPEPPAEAFIGEFSLAS